MNNNALFRSISQLKEEVTAPRPRGMSSYIAAAAACNSVSEIEQEIEQKHQTLRARLEESLQHSIKSFDLNTRRELHIAQKERARAERNYLRSTQQKPDSSLHYLLDGVDNQNMTSLQKQQDSVHEENRTSADVLTSIDAFRRLQMEEDRQKRMSLPAEGIAGMYNTLRRPLEDEDALLTDHIPTVKTLVYQEGKGAEAVSKRVVEYKQRREEMNEVTARLRELELLEMEEDSKKQMRRDLERYDELKVAPPVRIAPYTPATAQSAAQRDAFLLPQKDHPIDTYHAIIRSQMTGVGM